MLGNWTVLEMRLKLLWKLCEEKTASKRRDCNTACVRAISLRGTTPCLKHEIPEESETRVRWPDDFEQHPNGSVQSTLGTSFVGDEPSRQ